MVVLVCINVQMCVIEDEFLCCKILYCLIVGVCFYDCVEVKDVVVYLCVVCNFDDNVLLCCILNQLFCGIGKVIQQVIFCEVEDFGYLIWDVLCFDCFGGIGVCGVNVLCFFCDFIEELWYEVKMCNLFEFVQFVVECMGLLVQYFKDDFELQMWFDNLCELFLVVGEFVEDFG